MLCGWLTSFICGFSSSFFCCTNLCSYILIFLFFPSVDKIHQFLFFTSRSYWWNGKKWRHSFTLKKVVLLPSFTLRKVVSLPSFTLRKFCYLASIYTEKVVFLCVNIKMGKKVLILHLLKLQQLFSHTLRDLNFLKGLN